MKYIVVLISLIFMACGGGGTTSLTELPIYKGYFGDPPVKGLGYECGDVKDVTDDDGMFACYEFPVVFKMGNLTLGSISKLTADKKIFPQDIVGKSRSDFSDEKVLNLTRLLQSIDSNTDKKEEIEISKELSDTFTTEQNLSKLDEGEVQMLVEDSGQTYVAEDVAIEKLKDNVEKLVTLSITPKTATIALGKSINFTAHGSFSNSVQKDVTKDVVWSVDLDDIVYLSGERVSAKSVGVATIKASLDGVEMTATVTVARAYLTLLDISSVDKEIAVGSEMKLSALGTFSDDSTNEMTTLVVWSSSNPNIATVDKDGNVKALKNGTITITIRKDGISSSKTIVVNKAKLTGIKVTPLTQTVMRGDEGKITVIGTYENGQTQILTDSAEFSSSDEIVAFIDKGKVITLNAGITMISVKSGNFTAQINIVVLENVKQDLLDAHNEAREDVGVKSKLTWSDKITIDAQKYADEMAQSGVWEHDAKNHGGYTNGDYGENLYASTDKPTFAEATKAWVDEKAFYHYGVIGNDNTCDAGKMCGHYTQVIWEDTTEVGCAASQYKTGEYKDWYIVVCKYQTPGNYLNETPYDIIP